MSIAQQCMSELELVVQCMVMDTSV